MTEAVASLVAELAGTPLIGFAGGPFTLACYLVDGGPSKNFELTKSLMYGNPQLWDALLGRLADITIAFLRVQVAAGASAVQLFDSWAGALSPEDYRRCVLPHSTRIFDGAGRDRRAADPLRRGHRRAARRCWARPGADVVGVDWRVPLDEAVRRVGAGQGAAGQPGPGRAAGAVAGDRAAGPGGPGRGPRRPRGTCSTSATACCRETDPDVLARLTDLVHEVSAA